MRESSSTAFAFGLVERRSDEHSSSGISRTRRGNARMSKKISVFEYFLSDIILL